MRSCLIIASNFPPIQSAGVYRTLRLAKYLPEHGWKLNVLTLSPDTLLQGTSTDQALMEQIPSDINVYRAPARFRVEELNRLMGRNKKSGQSTSASTSSQSSNSNRSGAQKPAPGLFQRLKDRITLRWTTPDRLVGWVSPAVKSGVTAVKENATDVIYSSGPPWSNHLVAGRVSSATGLPWVADFRDPWLGNAFRLNRSGDTWEGRRHQTLELDVYQNASVIIFNTERAQDDAVGRIGDFLDAKSVVIPNGFDPENFESLNLVEGSTQGQSGPLRILHTGAFYGIRNVDSLLRVLGELKQEGKISADDFQLELIGRVRPHEQQLVQQHLIGDLVTLIPPVPHRECLRRLFGADVLLLVQTEAPLCVPGKLYEYIAVGRPILTLASEGATADLVDSESLGCCINPDQGEQLKSGLLDLIQQHRSGKLKCPDPSIRERFDGRGQMTLFDEVLRRAMSSGPNAKSSVGSTST